MELVLLWLVLCVVVGFLGNSRTIGFGGAFFLSLILSPLLGLIFVLVSKDKQTDAFEKKILENQQVQQQATVVSDELLTTQTVAESNLKVVEPQKNNDVVFFIIIVIAIIALVILFFTLW